MTTMATFGGFVFYIPTSYGYIGEQNLTMFYVKNYLLMMCIMAYNYAMSNVVETWKLCWKNLKSFVENYISMASLLVHVVNTFGCNDYLSYVTHNTLPLLAECDSIRTQPRSRLEASK